MKKIVLVLLVLISFSCENVTCKHEDKKIKVKMYMVNGRECVGSWLIPNCSNVYVDTFRGSYELKYGKCSDDWRGHTLKVGVVDFEYINK